MSIGDKGVIAFGANYVFHKVPYSGTATTFEVDQSATVATCVSPASGPTVSLESTGDSSTFEKTVTLAAGGANDGGNVIICTTHGKSVASVKP